MLLHGADGVPHGLEELVLAQQIDHQVPRVGGVLGEAAGPAEELDGGRRVVVRELEDLVDAILGRVDG